MAAPAFIAGDWGTTHLRLTLCDATGAPLDSVIGPGISQIQNEAAAAFAELIAPWCKQWRNLPSVLCGMVGSTIGWANVPYVSCPTAPERIADSMAEVAEGTVFIAPGLSCRNRHGAPDVMRGEETQILGALRLDASLQHGRHLLCLPGTHTKWTVLENGSVSEFLTSVTGELFAVVNQHSVLIRAGDSVDPTADATFQRALEQVKRFPDAALSHLLFECRSRQVMGELTRSAAPHFLSGLLIGQDVAAAKALFIDVLRSSATVAIIGTPQLTRLHAQALAAFDVPAREIDGAQASLAGLATLHAHRFAREGADVA
jgi:2-dehydro-3-deoxygalactonokinase